MAESMIVNSTINYKLYELEIKLKKILNRSVRGSFPWQQMNFFDDIESLLGIDSSIVVWVAKWQ